MGSALAASMKTLNIQFIHAKHWLWLWCFAMLGLAVLLITYAPRYYQLAKQRHSAQTQATQLSQQALPAPAAPKPADPRSAHSQQVASALQNDLNRVFTLVEAVKEPNTRLRNLSLDTPSSTVRLEYELDSMARASSVTLSLNAGYPEGPWRLESINAATAALSTNNAQVGFVPGMVSAAAPGLSQGAAPNPGQFRALWSANTSKL
jgi:hypothetical protein